MSSSFGVSNAGLIKWVWKCAPLLCFLRAWEGLVLVLWMFGRVYQWSHLVWTFFFCVGRFLITDSVSLFFNWSVQISCFFVIRSWLFMFLEIYPFLLGCQICWCVWVRSSLLRSFAFPSISCNVFSSWFYFCPVCFFLMSLAKSLSVLSFQRMIS